MRSTLARTALAFAALAWLLAVAPGARASDDLAAAKASGQVGERPDGYVGAVNANATPEIQALVADVNAKRKAQYAQIAAKNGTTVDAVAALAGAKLSERTPPGEYVLGVDGRWQKK